MCVVVSAEILQLHLAGDAHVPAERAARRRGPAAPPELPGVGAQTLLLPSEGREPVGALLQGLVLPAGRPAGAPPPAAHALPRGRLEALLPALGS